MIGERPDDSRHIDIPIIDERLGIVRKLTPDIPQMHVSDSPLISKEGDLALEVGASGHLLQRADA